MGEKEGLIRGYRRRIEQEIIAKGKIRCCRGDRVLGGKDLE